MIPLRSLSLILILLAAPILALPDPAPPVSVAPVAVQTRPVARPLGLYLAAVAATLACLDSQSGRRRC